MPILALLIFAGLALIDLPGLVKERNWREMLVYAALACLALVYLLRFVFGAEAWSPVADLSDFLSRTLGLDYALWQGRG